MSISNKNYLQGLNSLRFFAAFLVIISHGQLSLIKLNINKGHLFPIFTRGGDGVEFFFVLSGFLITYLLSKEVNKTGTISIREFYLRRVFRIWPLYFLIIIIGLIVLCGLFPTLFHKPYFNFPIWKWLVLYILFLPNLAASLYPMGLLHPLWSIGVEEQFYLFWAPIVKLFKNKMLLAILIFILLSSIWQILLEIKIFQFEERLNGFFVFQKFYAMSIGSFFGYALFHWKKRIQKSFICNKYFQYLLLFAVLIHLFYFVPYANFFLYKFLLAIIFGLIIFNTVSVENTIFKMEKQPLIYLGTISYGLYMYHMIVDYVLRIIFSKFSNVQNPILFSIIYFLLLILMTIIIAGFSFKYFEKYFLKIKDKHTL